MHDNRGPSTQKAMLHLQGQVAEILELLKSQQQGRERHHMLGHVAARAATTIDDKPAPKLRGGQPSQGQVCPSQEGLPA